MQKIILNTTTHDTKWHFVSSIITFFWIIGDHSNWHLWRNCWRQRLTLKQLVENPFLYIVTFSFIEIRCKDNTFLYSIIWPPSNLKYIKLFCCFKNNLYLCLVIRYMTNKTTDLWQLNYHLRGRLRQIKHKS